MTDMKEGIVTEVELQGRGAQHVLTLEGVTWRLPGPQRAEGARVGDIVQLAVGPAYGSFTDDEVVWYARRKP